LKVLEAALLALVISPAARAATFSDGPVTMTTRDVPLAVARGTRVLASVAPRFNMVALHWQGSGVPSFRTHSVGGGWSAWQAADDDWGRSGTWRMQGSPSWVGAADRIQYRLRGRVTRLRAYFLWSGAEPLAYRRLQLAGSPPIIPRAGWGANEEIRRAPPVYADAVRYALVHHTVNSNNYTASQSAAIVRGIEIYHVQGNGWNDIGYNFLVDKYGQIFEGRYGGIDRAVVGAHSEGFNTGSVGVAVIGTYTTTKIPAAAQSALEQLLAWRLDVAHVDPLSSVQVVSGGNPKYAAGTKLMLRAISGHRDTYPTECPGNALYAQLPQIAKDVAALGLPKLYSPAVTGGIGGPVRFTARLSTPLPWTVTVTDTTGKVVATGGGTGTTVDWTWDATNVAPGGYRWTIAAGPTVRPATGAIGAKPVALTLTGATANPSTIATTSQVTYTLSVPATVTATLVDANQVPVASLFTETRPAGKQAFTFTVSPTVADGQYAIVLTAQSPDGQQTTATIPIQIDRSIAAFTEVPAAISPNGDGRQDSVAVSFQLGEPGNATLAVTRNGSSLVTLASGPFAPGSTVAATWDGTTPAGPAPDGSYTVTLTVGSVTRTLPLAVDRRPPVLRPLSWTHLRFSVGEPAAVTLAVGPRRYVKQVKAAGRVYFWLRSLPRHYVVTAQDAAGNVTRLTR
jgi:hypothetical protein